MIVLASGNELLFRDYGGFLRDSHTVVEVPDLPGLTEVLRNQQPDVVFVDVVILPSDPQAALRTLCLQYPNVSFVVFGCPGDRALYLPFMTAGARGLLPLSSPPRLVLKVVEVVKRGELWLSRRGLASFLNEMHFAPAERLTGSCHLTERELQVGRIAATGLSNKEIAWSLGISERTVKAHISRLFVKLGIRCRSELILLGRTVNGSAKVESLEATDRVVRSEGPNLFGGKSRYTNTR